ncbi:MAG: trypsin-like peptidase domain-containing protein [Pirellulales bacterium]
MKIITYRIAFAATLLAVAAVGLSGEPNELALAELRRVEVISRLTPTVVSVFAPDGSEGGSGVVISSDGLVLTNYHVVLGTGPWAKCGLSDGKLYDAVIVGVDPTGDIALVKMFGRGDFPTAQFGDSDSLVIGDDVFVMGNPFMLATDLQPTVTYGIVSGLHRYQYPSNTFLEYTDCIQTDASINPGNSGGPLFDTSGRLVGINGRASFEKRGRINVGVGYAISINQARRFIGALRGGWIVDHASLGATAQTSGGRTIVSSVGANSDAQRRGLRFGDEIVELAGRDITTANVLKNVLGTYPSGWRVPLTYRRDNEWHDILVRLMPLHTPEDLAAQWQPDAQDRPGRAIPLPVPADEPPAHDDTRPGAEGHADDSPPRLEDLPDGVPPEPSPRNVPMPDDGVPSGQAPPPTAWPQIVRDHYATRPGFANYTFNLDEQRRVWASLGDADTFKSTGARGSWPRPKAPAVPCDW